MSPIASLPWVSQKATGLAWTEGYQDYSKREELNWEWKVKLKISLAADVRTRLEAMHSEPFSEISSTNLRK